MEYSEKVFLESSLYKGFEKWAEEEIGHWACIMQDCLEGELFDRGFSKEAVRWHINVATKHFQETHKTEIDASWEKVLKKTNTTRAQVEEIEAAINASL